MSSSPTETPPDGRPGFDPLEFWILHQEQDRCSSGLFVVALGAFGISEWSRHKTQRGIAGHCFAAANSTITGRSSREYPKSMSAASAQLLLADNLRDAGKYDESSAQLRTFIEKFPEHPLLSGAWTSLAANQEAQGKSDEALATYQKVVEQLPHQFQRARWRCSARHGCSRPRERPTTPAASTSR